jgi:hypothetical protein
MKEELSALKSPDGPSSGNRTQALLPTNTTADDVPRGPASIEQTTLVVQRTVNDTMRRRSNVIVTGIPEGDVSSDRQQFLLLCEDNLQMKPLVADNDCIRIGKKVPDKPRRLLVRLRSDETASALLRSAPLLRKSADKYVADNIYVNPDLSPAAAKLAFEARVARRERRLLRGRVTTANTQQTRSDQVNDVIDSHTDDPLLNQAGSTHTSSSNAHQSFQ